MKLRVEHITAYAYTPSVVTAQHMAHLTPATHATQRCVRHTITVSPTPAAVTETRDVYGNTRTFFSLKSVHEALTVTAESEVHTLPPPIPLSHLTWEHTRERFRYHAHAAYDAAAEFVFASPFVPRHPDFLAYARPSFAPGLPLLLAARDLMDRIHTDFTYASQSTEVNTPAVEALAQRKGVCQDFAHIMIACWRAMGLPARYVSGYMLTKPPPGKPRLVGSDASHAWVSVYVPDMPEGQRWCDFDPTNNRAPGEDYVTLGSGRDFADVSPMRGVIHGGAHHTLDVRVTVEPLDAEPPEPREPETTPAEPEPAP